VDAVQLGKQYHAFLFLGIGAGDHRDNGIGLAGIVGQMRNVSGDVEEVSRLHDSVMLKAVSVPYA
jgi:hypothetical protein